MDFTTGYSKSDGVWMLVTVQRQCIPLSCQRFSQFVYLGSVRWGLGKSTLKSAFGSHDFSNKAKEFASDFHGDTPANYSASESEGVWMTLQVVGQFEALSFQALCNYFYPSEVRRLLGTSVGKEDFGFRHRSRETRSSESSSMGRL